MENKYFNLLNSDDNSKLGTVPNDVKFINRDFRFFHKYFIRNISNLKYY